MLRLVALPLLLLPALASAQSPTAATPGQGRPNQAEARRAELDRLFEALKAAPDGSGAQLVEQRIRVIWAQGVSPAAGLLLRRGARNLQGNAPD
uniref:hypothetical protein n=1 Tax=Falsiroseomonas oryzae TaxID=2766473 RepID=UPI0022EB56BC